MANLETFEAKIADKLHPALTAKEMAEQFVIAALEAEFGKAFTLSPGFAKMVDTLSNMIVTNPDLRRQSLAIASSFINKSRDKNRTK